MPSYCSGGMASPDSVLTTAEDSLLAPPRPKLDPRPIFLLQQYSGDSRA